MRVSRVLLIVVLLVGLGLDRVTQTCFQQQVRFEIHKLDREISNRHASIAALQQGYQQQVVEVLYGSRQFDGRPGAPGAVAAAAREAKRGL